MYEETLVPKRQSRTEIFSFQENHSAQECMGIIESTLSLLIPDNLTENYVNANCLVKVQNAIFKKLLEGIKTTNSKTSYTDLIHAIGVEIDPVYIKKVSGSPNQVHLESWKVAVVKVYELITSRSPVGLLRWSSEMIPCIQHTAIDLKTDPGWLLSELELKLTQTVFKLPKGSIPFSYCGIAYAHLTKDMVLKGLDELFLTITARNSRYLELYQELKSRIDSL
jgi:hypothetical protein